MGSPGGQEQDATDGQIGKKHEEPNGRREGVQEGKVAGLAALVGKLFSNATAVSFQCFVKLQNTISQASE